MHRYRRQRCSRSQSPGRSSDPSMGPEWTRGRRSHGGMNPHTRQHGRILVQYGEKKQATGAPSEHETLSEARSRHVRAAWTGRSPRPQGTLSRVHEASLHLVVIGTRSGGGGGGAGGEADLPELLPPRTQTGQRFWRKRLKTLLEFQGAGLSETSLQEAKFRGDTRAPRWTHVSRSGFGTAGCKPGASAQLPRAMQTSHRCPLSR